MCSNGKKNRKWGFYRFSYFETSRIEWCCHFFCKPAKSNLNRAQKYQGFFFQNLLTASFKKILVSDSNVFVVLFLHQFLSQQLESLIEVVTFVSNFLHKFLQFSWYTSTDRSETEQIIVLIGVRQLKEKFHVNCGTVEMLIMKSCKCFFDWNKPGIEIFPNILGYDDAEISPSLLRDYLWHHIPDGSM